MQDNKKSTPLFSKNYSKNDRKMAPSVHLGPTAKNLCKTEDGTSTEARKYKTKNSVTQFSATNSQALLCISRFQHCAA